MSELRGTKVHITGIVQGVGFRPFVYGLATRYALKGWVRNTSAGVDIEVDGPEDSLQAFLKALRDELPPLARIDSLEAAWRDSHGFQEFEIVPSEELEGAFQPISPDVAICPDCLHELFDPQDRRYRYPFINCTNCGPRFTIITDIPYDRPKTTMARFAMCPDCAAEYIDPRNRRFHAQPVACPVCGPSVWLEDGSSRPGAGQPKRGDEAIRKAQHLLGAGKILAVKGLGGFHLACDATNPIAVAELRRRKLRVDKPFALMMLDLSAVQRHCRVSQAERDLLESRARPIVLLHRRAGSGIALEVAPQQETLGVMLPYTPLHYLLLVDSQPELTALVMTSGNLSEEPIATDNDEARQRLAALADGFLMHDRDIRTRCDDSVVRVFPSGVDDQPPPGAGLAGRKHSSGTPVGGLYPLRRSRGYAPDSIQLPVEVPPILAVGPELKNTFCLTRDRYAFLSHHIGDMQNYETLRSFEDGIAHYERLFRIRPQAIAHDMHPDYLPTRYALQRGMQAGLPTLGIQHHHAHIAACMADNGLCGEEPVIGVSFDGTGYGEDGAIWGGEFLVADYAAFQRPFHIAYFPLPGGDAAIRRPARTALALLWSLGMEWEEFLAPCADLCAEERLALRVQLERSLNTPLTSSLGRLFDAVAALAGGRQKVNYEAQAAIELEAALDPGEGGAYPFEPHQAAVDLAPAIQALLADVRAGIALPVISARFHNGLAEMVCQVCLKIRRESGLSQVALSGGVWQNMALLERTIVRLRAEHFPVLIHHQVPANDGGVSLGQAVVAATRLRAGG
ncbi:MAG: carbamoyltransferase HypF [Anaerolineales bacterium]|jgi:hydrogenase maturation protein HypF